MRKLCLAFVMPVMVGLASAQAPAATTLAAGTRVNAELKTKLDTAKAKVGDTVTAVATDGVKERGQTVLPKGATLTGHVTQVAAAPNSHSAADIAVVFTQASTRTGESIALAAGIVRVASTPAPAGMSADDDMNMGGMGGASSAGGMHAPTDTGMGMGGGAAAAPVSGVVVPAGGGGAGVAGSMAATGGGDLRSINGVAFQIAMPVSAAAAMASGTTLRSSQGNLRIDRGTHIELQIFGAAAAGQ